MNVQGAWVSLAGEFECCGLSYFCLLFAPEEIYSDYYQYSRYVTRKLVGMYLVLAKRAYRRSVGSSLESEAVSSDVVGFDCSRVSCREVLCVHIYSHNRFIVAPLSIMPDQFALQDATTALSNLKLSMLTKWGEKRTKLKQPTGASTKSLCLSLMMSLSCILPYATSGVWRPLSRDLPSKSSVRLWDSEKEHWFNWDPQSGSAHYCLCPSLWPKNAPGHVNRPVKIFIMCCDEGSQGCSLWWYCMSLGWRVLMYRDPAHRMSNAFNNATRGVKRAMQAAMSTLLVHKFRRGPWGSGRFMRELRETMQIVRHRGYGHPILVDFLPQIARDCDLCAEDLQDDPSTLRRILDHFILSGHCQRVETRRLWTPYDANIVLDGLWHTLLVALCMYFYMNGVDPFQFEQELQEQAKTADDANVRDFVFKHSVLTILLTQMYQNIMRSQLVAFRLLRYHHADFVERHSDASSPRAFHLLWST